MDMMTEIRDEFSLIGPAYIVGVGARTKSFSVEGM